MKTHFNTKNKRLERKPTLAAFLLKNLIFSAVRVTFIVIYDEFPANVKKAKHPEPLANCRQKAASEP